MPTTAARLASGRAWQIHMPVSKAIWAAVGQLVEVGPNDQPWPLFRIELMHVYNLHAISLDQMRGAGFLPRSWASLLWRQSLDQAYQTEWGELYTGLDGWAQNPRVYVLVVERIQTI